MWVNDADSEIFGFSVFVSIPGSVLAVRHPSRTLYYCVSCGKRETLGLSETRGQTVSSKDTNAQ